MDKEEIIIIGGGVGGLFTAALLARNGYPVTVLEKNAAPGGGLQHFVRYGQSFETGMHIVGGLLPGQNLYRICQYLDIVQQIKVHPTDAQCMDTITYLGNEPFTYRVPAGRDAFVDYFSALFPHEAQGIRHYVDAMFRMADEVDLFNLRMQSTLFVNHGEEFMMPADAFIARYISDSRLRDVLAYMNPMYGGVAGHTPAYIHTMVNVFYINGSCFFTDSGASLVTALVNTIEQAGGRVVTGDAVTHIHVTDRQVQYVTTARQQRYTAGRYVSAIHPQELLRLTGDGAFPKAYANRLMQIPCTYSAFVVYVLLKPGTFRYINHPCYVQDDYGKVWQHGQDLPQGDEGWPHGFMYLTPPQLQQGAYATHLTVNCLMPFQAVAQWQHTTLGHREPAYKAWKEQTMQQVLRKLEMLYPGFDACVQQAFAATPLTIRDYYGTPQGALYGYRKDCTCPELSQLHLFTKVSNLMLTGQNIYLHGICGVPLTAVATAEAIMGRGTILSHPIFTNPNTAL